MSILESSIGEYSIKDVTTIGQSETIKDAIEKMVNRRFRRLPILDYDSNLTAIVTSTDLLKFLYNEGTTASLDESIETIMSHDLITVKSNTTVKDTIIKMSEEGISGIPIARRKKLEGIFTEKDVLLIGQLWQGIPDEFITSELGIGKRTVEKNYIITDDVSIWEAMDRIINSNQRQLLLKQAISNYYTGIITIMNILATIVSNISFNGKDLTFLESASVRSIIKAPILQKASPVLVSSIRMWMNSRGIEAVPIFHHNNPVKLVTEKDLILYLVKILQED